jgi:protein CpxP
LLLPYFQSLSISTIQVDEEMVLNEIQQLEKEKIQVTHQHFQDLKSILTSEQIPHFEVFTQEFINHVLLGGKKHSPPPKGF